MTMLDIPINPPKNWFEKPEEGIPTDRRITISDDGRVYGYVALWNSCHTGGRGCTRPPKGSPSNYEYAHHGETLTEEGELIRTAVIAGGAGHAPIDEETAMVPAYYDNSGTQLMRVRYGEDENGLYFAGALWPNVTELQTAHIRASSLSGDWRFHAMWRRGSGGFDFAGACLVNIPGFTMKAKGGAENYAGSPYRLAASGYLNEENEDYIFLDGDNLLASGGSEMDEEENSCDGSCNECTCGKKELDLEKLGITEEDLLAAGYQLVGKPLKKKPKTIKADGDGVEDTETEEETETVVETIDLGAQVADIKKAVDWLVAEKLTEQITAEN